MADYIPGIEPEQLYRRVIFLHSRADAHLEAASDRTLHLACAATLLRDAACISILLGKTSKARQYLQQAGHLFLQLGLAAGSTLIALAATRTVRDELASYSDVIEGVRHQWSRAETRDRDESRRPMTAVALGAPRQMFSLLQTEWLMAEVEAHPSIRADTGMRVALERNGGYPAGETGLSIDSYAKMADWMTEHRGKVADEMPSFVMAGMATLTATRAEQIRAAMKDSYHWRMLARPSELLDIDGVVLMFLALGGGMSKGMLATLLATDVALDDAPLKAALLLRQDQDL